MRDPFPTTRWSLVMKVQGARSDEAGEALSTLCELYWFPLYAYVRRRGHSPEDAADLVQGYFSQLLERRFIDAAQPGVGRFRAFLLHKLKQFLANERDRQRTLKRGGETTIVSLDINDAERRYGIALADRGTPETEFDRRWAMTAIDRVIHRLAQHAERRGKLVQFHLLRDCLTQARPRLSYREIASQMSTTEAAVKSSVHRLRRRFGELLRQEIAETLRDPADVDDEVRHLFSVLA